MDLTITRDRLTIRLAKENDRRQLARLIHFCPWVHRHLDWRTPLDWLGYQPYLIVERDGQLLAALACPPDPPEIAWIRLLAISSEFTIADAWKVLWQSAYEYLWGITVAAIPIQSWFSQQLISAQFEHTHDVAMFAWENQKPPPKYVPPNCILRLMNHNDLTVIKELDSLAFGPIWQQSFEMLEVAFKQSAHAMVAETSEGIVGYQVSTTGSGGSHLARLAVHPMYQGKGIGYALTRDMLAYFHHRGSLKVTVNTQTDNHASLALYKKVGFRPTGETFPVYKIILD
jgi:ribosomal protein S18 acetylase RimI-like enzyme